MSRTSETAAIAPHLGAAGESQANSLGCGREISIPGHDHDLLIAEFEGGGEVDCVISAQAEAFGEFSAPSGEADIDADAKQFALEVLERGEGLGVPPLVKATLAPRCGEGRPALRVGEDARCRRVAAVPQFGS